LVCEGIWMTTGDAGDAIVWSSRNILSCSIRVATRRWCLYS
jgi:hypothetical protein